MIRRLVEILRSEVSGEAALDYVAGVARYHRIQASPGFREAAKWCAARLVEAGLKAEVLSYPARFEQRFWSTGLFQEWSCRKATLDLVSPAKESRPLADFRANPQSVIQRSVSTPPGGVRAGVVVVDKADRPESYAGVDVAGKFVLFTGNAQVAYELAVAGRGAAGLVTDQMPEFPPVRRAFELPAATTYTSFWPTGPFASPAVGFVVSPAEGARLRRLVREAEAGAPVVLDARVDADLYDGEIENVTAVIQGDDPAKTLTPAGFGEPEEVLLVAHLCHPKPSANDNASGCGALIEVARALSTLIASAKLPRPRRSIRFLLVPEMTGTYAYLATREKTAPPIVAALNLDMIGENQALTGGPLQLEYPPLSCPDFVGDLLSSVVEVASEEAGNLSGTAKYPLFMLARTPFSGGSDHYILSDPTVGVPCPMFIQFPDRFYHTSADTMDKVDPVMLSRVSVMAAAYLYFWASAGPREAAWLAERMTGYFARVASSLVDAEAGGVSGEVITRRLGFLAERKTESLRALARGFGGREAGNWLPRLEREAQAAATREEGRLRDIVAALDLGPAGLVLAAALGGSDPAGASDPSSARWLELAGRVPRRAHPGPIDLRTALGGLPAERRVFWRALSRANEKGYGVADQFIFWMDGRRTLAEAAELLELETGFRNEAFTSEFVDLLLETGLVTLG